MTVMDMDDRIAGSVTLWSASKDAHLDSDLHKDRESVSHNNDVVNRISNIQKAYFSYFYFS